MLGVDLGNGAISTTTTVCSTHWPCQGYLMYECDKLYAFQVYYGGSFLHSIRHLTSGYHSLRENHASTVA
jgi:hypothetical protein